MNQEIPRWRSGGRWLVNSNAKFRRHLFRQPRPRKEHNTGSSITTIRHLYTAPNERSRVIERQFSRINRTKEIFFTELCVFRKPRF